MKCLCGDDTLPDSPMCATCLEDMDKVHDILDKREEIMNDTNTNEDAKVTEADVSGMIEAIALSVLAKTLGMQPKHILLGARFLVAHADDLLETQAMLDAGKADKANRPIMAPMPKEVQ